MSVNCTATRNVCSLCLVEHKIFHQFTTKKSYKKNNNNIDTEHEAYHKSWTALVLAFAFPAMILKVMIKITKLN